jgi:putative FmdB family regulatory protein
VYIKEKDLPTYSYKCEECNHRFESFQSFKDFTPLTTCPNCNQNTLVRDYQSDLPSGSVKKGDDQLTVGELAARNTERFSEDYKEHLHIKNHSYMKNPPKYKASKAERKIRDLQDLATGLGGSVKPKKKKGK